MNRTVAWHVGTTVASLFVALAASGCAPTRSDVIGVYDLHGDPQRRGLVWDVRSDGSLDVSGPSTNHVTGRWFYSTDWPSPMGHLRVDMPAESHVYDVMVSAMTPVMIIVDHEKYIEL